MEIYEEVVGYGVYTAMKCFFFHDWVYNRGITHITRACPKCLVCQRKSIETGEWNEEEIMKGIFDFYPL